MGSWELPCLLEMMTSQEDADASLPMDSFQLCQFFAKVSPQKEEEAYFRQNLSFWISEFV